MTYDALPLKDEVLTLRRLRRDDLEAFQSYRTDPDIARLQGWSIASDAESLEFLERMHAIAHFVPDQWFQLGVAITRSDHLIGDVGVCLESSGRAQIGYSIHAAHQRRGYGSRAVELAMAYIFAASDAREVVAFADVRNEASWRLLERVGMTRREKRRAVYDGEMCEEYGYGLSRR